MAVEWGELVAVVAVFALLELEPSPVDSLQTLPFGSLDYFEAPVVAVVVVVAMAVAVAARLPAQEAEFFVGLALWTLH